MKKEVKDTPFSSWNVYRQFSNQLPLLYQEEHGRLTYDVAKYLGMDRKNYGHYKEIAYEYCPLPILEKLATLYHILLTDLIDDYHLFLYNGQGNRVLQYRENMHLTQQEIADKLGINRTTVRLWEKEFHCMTRPTYEALFIPKILE